jgi:AhpD family alkylhydroperoxidase
MSTGTDDALTIREELSRPGCRSVYDCVPAARPQSHSTDPPMTALVNDTAAPPVSPRIDYQHLAPAAVHAQRGLETYIRSSGLEMSLIHLMKLRASYINGCAYCVDMHTKHARAEGETEQRLYAVPVWRATPFFTPRERAALAWTDAVTELGRDHVPDELFDEVRQHFTDIEIVNLTMVVVTINGWNRIAIALRQPAGTYVPPARRT